MFGLSIAILSRLCPQIYFKYFIFMNPKPWSLVGEDLTYLNAFLN
jgi:hypothetical protein